MISLLRILVAVAADAVMDDRQIFSSKYIQKLNCQISIWSDSSKFITILELFIGYGISGTTNYFNCSNYSESKYLYIYTWMFVYYARLLINNIFVDLALSLSPSCYVCRSAPLDSSAISLLPLPLCHFQSAHKNSVGLAVCKRKKKYFYNIKKASWPRWNVMFRYYKLQWPARHF